MFLIRLQEKNESKTLTKDIIKFDEKKKHFRSVVE